MKTIISNNVTVVFTHTTKAYAEVTVILHPVTEDWTYDDLGMEIWNVCAAYKDLYDVHFYVPKGAKAYKTMTCISITGDVCVMCVNTEDNVYYVF